MLSTRREAATHKQAGQGTSMVQLHRWPSPAPPSIFGIWSDSVDGHRWLPEHNFDLGGSQWPRLPVLLALWNQFGWVGSDVERKRCFLVAAIDVLPPSGSRPLHGSAPSMAFMVDVSTFLILGAALGGNV
jgi:hypothetical protein